MIGLLCYCYDEQLTRMWSLFKGNRVALVNQSSYINGLCYMLLVVKWLMMIMNWSLSLIDWFEPKIRLWPQREGGWRMTADDGLSSTSVNTSHTPLSLFTSHGAQRPHQGRAVFRNPSSSSSATAHELPAPIWSDALRTGCAEQRVRQEIKFVRQYYMEWKRDQQHLMITHRSCFFLSFSNTQQQKHHGFKERSK